MRSIPVRAWLTGTLSRTLSLNQRLPRLRLVLLMALLLFCGWAFSYHYSIGVTLTPTGAVEDNLFSPTFPPKPGPQYVMVYVGAGFCPWSNRPDIASAIENIKSRLAARAVEEGVSFKTVGVAMDWRPSRGLEHLQQIGKFHEVAAGYSWANTFALQHFWADPNGPTLGTPVVLVYRQSLVMPTAGGPVHYEETDRTLLVVKQGHQEIVHWAAEGAPLPAT